MINQNRRIKLPQNPYLLFLPFLLLYIAIVLLLQHVDLWGDEFRHVSHAKNLIKGFYSEPAPKISFDVGPGYPIVLVPFLALHIPFLMAKLLNAIFLYLSVVFLFKTLRFYVSFRISLIVCIFWACYYNSFYYLPLLYTEIFTSFLITIFLYFIVKSFRQDEKVFFKNKNFWISGIIFGFLALTKVIFGYVLFFILIGAIILWLFARKNIFYKKTIVMLFISTVIVSPYLAHTYKLTGRFFYWATSAGNNLYWMTTPHSEEYGTWFPDVDISSGSLINLDTIALFGNNKILKRKNTFFITGFEDSVVKNHFNDFVEISKYSGIERDDALKKIAINNIKNYPDKFIKNCISNVGRILFNTPNSYILQRPGNLTKLPLNGTIVLLSLFCIIPTLLNWRKLEYHFKLILFISLLYFGGSILGSAELRMFTTIVPLLLFWITCILSKSIKIKLKFHQSF